MITAKEAKKLAGPSVTEQVEDALNDLSKMIKEAAEKKSRSITIRSNPYAGWAYNKNNLDEVGRQVFDALEDNGYELETFYRELQFADYGLIIKW